MVTLTENIAGKKLKKLLSDVAATHRPVKIKGRKSNAILISEDDWKSIKETLYLLSVPGMRKSIVNGLKTPVEKCTDKLKW